MRVAERWTVVRGAEMADPEMWSRFAVAFRWTRVTGAGPVRGRAAAREPSLREGCVSVRGDQLCENQKR